MKCFLAKNGHFKAKNRCFKAKTRHFNEKFHQFNAKHGRYFKAKTDNYLIIIFIKFHETQNVASFKIFECHEISRHN